MKNLRQTWLIPHRLREIYEREVLEHYCSNLPTVSYGTMQFLRVETFTQQLTLYIPLSFR